MGSPPPPNLLLLMGQADSSWCNLAEPAPMMSAFSSSVVTQQFSHCFFIGMLDRALSISFSDSKAHLFHFLFADSASPFKD